jgi:hypothetical protein
MGRNPLAPAEFVTFTIGGTDKKDIYGQFRKLLRQISTHLKERPNTGKVRFKIEVMTREKIT